MQHQANFRAAHNQAGALALRPPLTDEERRARSFKSRELRLLVDLLVVMLALPKGHPNATLDNGERSRMGQQLARYRRELERRSMQRNPEGPAKLTRSMPNHKAKFH